MMLHDATNATTGSGSIDWLHGLQYRYTYVDLREFACVQIWLPDCTCAPAMHDLWQMFAATVARDIDLHVYMYIYVLLKHKY